MERSIFGIQADFCRAMGNSTRLQILHVLREYPMTVTEIMVRLGVSQSMVSRQLAVLRSVGVVAGERRGHEIVYCLTDKKIGEVCDLVRAVLVEQTQKQSLVLNDL
jgi:DNA-binding transcriptional ArsR family regulator